MEHERGSELPDESMADAPPHPRPAEKKKRVRLPTSKKGNGVRPGVDLYDSAAPLDLMERDDARIGLL